MPRPTRRAGVKRRLNILRYALENSPASECYGDYLGTGSRTYNDPKYEEIFAAHNPSVNEVERRDGYKPWPFKLRPIDVSQTASTPSGYNRREDPRYHGYPLAWAHSIIDETLLDRVRKPYSRFPAALATHSLKTHSLDPGCAKPVLTTAQYARIGKYDTTALYYPLP